jgi:hypothetical protein
VEEYFFGDHSDVGGAQKPNYQNKANDIGKLTLNRSVEVINNISETDIYRTPSTTQQPSTEFLNLYNNYQTVNTNFGNDLLNLDKVSAANFYNNIQNQNQTYQQIKDGYVHSEVSIIKPWNWSIGSGRDIFYSNDQLRLSE